LSCEPSTYSIRQDASYPHSILLQALRSVNTIAEIALQRLKTAQPRPSECPGNNKKQAHGGEKKQDAAFKAAYGKSAAEVFELRKKWLAKW
jgi:hypothetical protein